jgi:hypothetical protein
VVFQLYERENNKTCPSAYRFLASQREWYFNLRIEKDPKIYLTIPH